jgi:hypothetical protein
MVFQRSDVPGVPSLQFLHHEGRWYVRDLPEKVVIADAAVELDAGTAWASPAEYATQVGEPTVLLVPERGIAYVHAANVEGGRAKYVKSAEDPAVYYREWGLCAPPPEEVTRVFDFNTRQEGVAFAQLPPAVQQDILDTIKEVNEAVARLGAPSLQELPVTAQTSGYAVQQAIQWAYPPATPGTPPGAIITARYPNNLIASNWIVGQWDAPQTPGEPGEPEEPEEPKGDA